MPQSLPQLTPEVLVPRLGEHLVSLGLVTAPQLQQALELQREARRQGRHVLLGNALIELKFIERTALDHAITEQILQLRSVVESADANLQKRVDERTRELNQTVHDIAAFNHLSSSFVANLSLELRTPLANIVDSLNLLAAGSLGPVNGPQREALQVNRRSALRLASLTDDLILFTLASRAESTGRIELTDMGRIVTETVEAAGHKAAERGITLHAQPAERLPRVQANAERITWVISQLLDNGIKFTPKGGSMFVSATSEAPSPTVVVSVADMGKGIPAARLSEIREASLQLHAPSNGRRSGSGFGLMLAQHILHAHGSQLEIESEVGRGSTFRFRLAALPEAP